MFNNKPYTTINREERHYGFLFGSSLIHDINFAEAIIMYEKRKMYINEFTLGIPKK